MLFFLENMRLADLAAKPYSLDAILKPEDHSGHHYCFVPEPLTFDSDGFVTSFAVEEAAGIREFFAKYGFVVVRNLADSSACEASIAEIWSLLERECPGLQRSDAGTWQKRWPSLAQLGIVGNAFPLSPQFFRNRQTPDVHRAFAILFGTQKLMVNVGRASVMRPTVGLKLNSGDPNVADRPEWRTVAGESWLHWDLNPFTGASSSFSWRVKDMMANRGYNRLRVQGVLALCDSGPDDGGFFCVPGSHRVIRGWAAEHMREQRQGISHPESCVQVHLPEGDELRQHGQKVPIRAGSLLIWNAALAHCNYPNQSSNFRMAQYIQMVQHNDPCFGPLLPDERFLPPSEEFEPSVLGRKLFGLEPWESDEPDVF